MSPKKITTLLFLCLQATFTIAINQYRVGDTLFVWATSGLVLREAADFSAKKIEVVPFGSVLICQDDKAARDFDTAIIEQKSYTQLYTSKKCPALYLKGKFVEVRFGKKMGYVFDAFLSKLPVPKFKTFNFHGNTRVEKDELDKWIDVNFKESSRLTIGKPEDYFEETIIYKNGIIKKWVSYFEKGGSSAIMFPNLSLEEGYLIFNFFENFGSGTSLPQNHYEKWEFSETPSSFTFLVDGAGCSFKLQTLPFPPFLVFMETCGC